MIIQLKKDWLYDHHRCIGIEIERNRQRMLSMYHYVVSLRIRLWWFDYRISALYSTYV